jgi:uncharacterized protein YegJ (DUF2314 family)
VLFGNIAKRKEIGMTRTALVLLALTLLLTCCSDHSYDPVTEVEFDDKDMNAAIDDARASLAEFVERLKNPKPTDESFSVKKKISDGKEVEHLWVTDVSYSDGKFTGVINEDPQSVRNVKFGQKVTVEETEILDWMYLDDGELVGNFTLRVLLKRMP